jgi:hypothetical protein
LLDIAPAHRRRASLRACAIWSRSLVYVLRACKEERTSSRPGASASRNSTMIVSRAKRRNVKINKYVLGHRNPARLIIVRFDLDLLLLHRVPPPLMMDRMGSQIGGVECRRCRSRALGRCEASEICSAGRPEEEEINQVRCCCCRIFFIVVPPLRGQSHFL